MDEELYVWLESRSGCSYEMSDSIQFISGDTIFTDTEAWYIEITNMIDKLDEIMEIIDIYWRELPDDFPSPEKLKKIISSEILGSIIDIIKTIERKLGIEPVDINDYDTLLQTIDALREIVIALSTTSLEKLLEDHWFTKYDQDNQYVLTETFCLQEGDLTNMHFTVNDIIEMHDEDEE